MADFVVANLFKTGSDPTGSSSKIGIAPLYQPDLNALSAVSQQMLYEYIRPWYETLHEHEGLRGIVLYDELPEGFAARWTSTQVAFATYPTAPRYDDCTSTVLRRLAMLRVLLEHRPDISRIWFTDINDVAFAVNPFDWMDRTPFGDRYLFAGEEWTTFAKSQWWSGQAAFFGGEYQTLLSRQCADRYLVTVGTWGGSRAIVIALLDLFLAELDRLIEAGVDLRNRPGGCADMAIMNLIVYKHLFQNTVTFKLEAALDRLVFESGVFFRAAGNPIMHHRPAALKMAADMATRRASPLQHTA